MKSFHKLLSIERKSMKSFHKLLSIERKSMKSFHKLLSIERKSMKSFHKLLSIIGAAACWLVRQAAAPSRAYTFGAAFYTTELTNLGAGVTGVVPVRAKVNRWNGRLRVQMGSFTNPAAGGAAIADSISWVRIPVPSRLLGYLSLLSWGAGAASCTLNVGDSVTAARYKAATSVTAAGNLVPNLVDGALGAPGFEITDETLSAGVPTATNTSEIRSVVAGAAVAASQAFTFTGVYAHD